MGILNQIKKGGIKMKKALTLLLLLPLLSMAQQESYYSLYRFNMQVINPAYAGAEAENMLSLLNRTQWAALDDSPRTMAMAFSSRRENNVGLGLSVVADKVFVERQTFAYADFSYKLDLTDQTRIFLGLKAGGNFYRSSSLGLEDYNTAVDPAQKEFSRFNPNVGAGMYLQNEKYWVSFSIPRLFNVKRDDDISIGAKDRVHSYLGAGINFSLGDDLYLKPNVMFRKVAALPLSADLGAFFSVQNRIDFGASYRTNASFSFMTYINVIDGIDVGYAYETPSNTVLAGQNIKTHEIFFRLRLGENVQTQQEDQEQGE